VQLRTGTKELHVIAERSGIMRELLRERAVSPVGYVALIASLHAIYSALEGELDRHATHLEVAPVYFPELARTARLAADLAIHRGRHPDAAAVGPAPTAVDYAAHLHLLGATDPGRLIAHCYVRYLGDLSGGQLLASIVADALGAAADEGFAFYDFSALDDVDAFKRRYRAALDSLPLSPARMEQLVDEAKHAFALHARIFCEIARPAG
jgi:heme oxygenase